MRFPSKRKGDIAEAILMLVDLGLKPHAIAAAIGTHPTYVYLVIRRAGRIMGDGRNSESTIIRNDPNSHDYSRIRHYIERLFIDAHESFQQLHSLASATYKARVETLAALAPKSNGKSAKVIDLNARRRRKAA